MESSLRKTIDYMLRYQWKETRNIVNRALSKVTQPRLLKDLFFSNVIDASPEIWYEQPIIVEPEPSQKSKALDAVSHDSGLTLDPTE